MGLPKLWGKDSDGNHGFIFSHVKTIYYNWSQKKLLKDKLDEMDTLITENADAIAQRLVTNTALNTALANYVSKSMMSGTQVNDANKVPNSALAYAMAQTITQNATNIESLNGRIEGLHIIQANTIDEINRNITIPYATFGITYFKDNNAKPYATAYLSIDFEWIRLQFKVTYNSTQCRTIYGQSTPLEWKDIYQII